MPVTQVTPRSRGMPSLRSGSPSVRLRSGSVTRSGGDGTPTPRVPLSARRRDSSASAAGSVRSGVGASHPAPECENIVAAVRVRSFLQREMDRGDEMCIRMKDRTTEVSASPRSKKPEKTYFTFDHCFWSVKDDEVPVGVQYASQAEVYNTLGVPVVDNAMKGYNSAVIAYGQTGSGKSYSIFGPPEMAQQPELEGLIPRICKELFARMQNPPKGTTYKVTASMIEIYMEKVYDLLNNRNQLTIRGNLSDGFSVPGRRRVAVGDYHRIALLLAHGEDRKTTAQTALNERSSRAHTMFELELCAIHKHGDEQVTSKVTLCDLAGSERCKDAKTAAGGKEFNQARQINLSLLCLGTCVEKVVQWSTSRNDDVGRRSVGPTEFRGSALTKLLKDSLGGNSKTVILTTISPSKHDLHTTMLALRFANRAKQIQNHAVINESTIWDVKHKAKVLAELNAERIKALQHQLELETREGKLSEERLNLQARERELRKEAYTLEEDKRKLAQAREASEANKRWLREREQDLQHRLDLVHKEHADLEKTYEKLEKDRAEYYDRHREVSSRAELLEDKVFQLELEVTNHEKRYEDAKSEHLSEMAECQRRHAHELGLLKNAHRDEIARVREEGDRKTREVVHAMQHVYKRKEVEADEYAKRASELKEKLEQVQPQSDLYSQQLGTLTLDYCKLEESSKKNKSEADGAKESAEELQRELDAKKREADRLNDRLSQATWEGETVRKRLGELHGQLSQRESEADDLRDELRKVQLAIGDIRRQLRQAARERRAAGQGTVLLPLAKGQLEHSGVFVGPDMIVERVMEVAAQAGVKAGMRLRAVNGQQVRSADEVAAALAASRDCLVSFKGKPTQLPLPRRKGYGEGQPVDAVQGLGELLAAEGVELAPDGVIVKRVCGRARDHGIEEGMVLEPPRGEDPPQSVVFRAQGAEMRIPRGSTLAEAGLRFGGDGVTVFAVDADTSPAAAAAGVRRGMELAAVDGRPVRSHGEADDVLAAPQDVAEFVQRQDAAAGRSEPEDEEPDMVTAQLSVEGAMEALRSELQRQQEEDRGEAQELQRQLAADRAELTAARSELQVLQETQRQRQRSLDAVKDLNEQSARKIANLERQLAEAQSVIAQHTEEIPQLKEQLLQTEQLAQSRGRELEAERELMVKEQQECVAKVQEVHAVQSEKDEQLRGTLEQLQQAQKDLDERRQKEAELAAENSSLSQRQEDLARELADTQQRLDEASGECRRKEDELRAAVDEWSRKADQQKQELADMEARLEQLADEKTRGEEELRNAHQQALADMEERLEQVAEEKRKQEEELRSANLAQEELRDALQQASAAKDAVEQDAAQLQEKLEELQNDLSAREHDALQQAARAVDLTNKVDQRDEDIRKKAQHINALQGELQAAKRDKDRLTGELDGKAQRVRKLEQERSALRRQIKEMESREEILDKMNRIADQIKAETGEARNKIHRQNAEVQPLLQNMSMSSIAPSGLQDSPGPPRPRGTPLATPLDATSPQPGRLSSGRPPRRSSTDHRTPSPVARCLHGPVSPGGGGFDAAAAAVSGSDSGSEE
eukprot:TRINITY_DN3070_c0_g1_i1.p1 TRINITY_DN3070_c0_g1~~TRINITY_DN3070_c0_g1_i1.p1  ORF type:complete len:1563 (+),score=509.72 TRINITY_DN3070_c0_g1_i1:92-4780(+)